MVFSDAQCDQYFFNVQLIFFFEGVNSGMSHPNIAYKIWNYSSQGMADPSRRQI